MVNSCYKMYCMFHICNRICSQQLNFLQILTAFFTLMLMASRLLTEALDDWFSLAKWRTICTMSAKPIVVVSSQKKACPSIWHCWLWHCSFEAVKLLKQNGLIDTTAEVSFTFVCNSCQLAKEYRLPFVNPVVGAESPCSKIHCDLWGNTSSKH